MKQLIAISCSALIIFIYLVIEKDLIHNTFFMKTMQVILLSVSLIFIGTMITKNIEKHFLLSIITVIALALATILIIFFI